MKYIKSEIMREAFARAGYRERFAMAHGKKILSYINGEKCYIFIYDSSISYQDANGATYNATRGAWVG